MDKKDSFERDAVAAFCAGLSGMLDANKLTCRSEHTVSTYETLSEKARQMGCDPRTAKRRLGKPDAQLRAGEKIIALYQADLRVREINARPQEIEI
jgi:hypothetical protein